MFSFLAGEDADDEGSRAVAINAVQSPKGECYEQQPGDDAENEIQHAPELDERRDKEDNGNRGENRQQRPSHLLFDNP